MRRQALLLLVLIALLLPAAAGCSPRPTITTDASGLRTFKVVRNPDGSQPPCAAFGLADPVIGTLEGKPGATDPVWLVADDGRHLSVVWPEGFKLRFEPEATIITDRGTVVAQAPGRMTLAQTRWSDAAGAFDDPYFASGLVFGGCYQVAMH